MPTRNFLLVRDPTPVLFKYNRPPCLAPPPAAAPGEPPRSKSVIIQLGNGVKLRLTTTGRS